MSWNHTFSGAYFLSLEFLLTFKPELKCYLLQAVFPEPLLQDPMTGPMDLS